MSAMLEIMEGTCCPVKKNQQSAIHNTADIVGVSYGSDQAVLEWKDH